MKFTLSWLKEYLDTNASLQEICEKLNNIGLEVESIEEEAKNLSDFFVAQITEAAPHPQSQKLQICSVDIGQKEPLQVICGAENARKNLKVAFAPIGSTIPNGKMKIKKAKIAGIESFGMICSAVELGLGEDSEGIIEIDPKFSIKTKIADVFNLSEVIIEVNITPNRGDCLGVYGIARDLAASGIGTLKQLKINNPKAEFSSPISVKINSKNCNYFAGCYIKNIKNCPSPKWLQGKLEAVGINPISAAVDISNYVMICLNQPIHFYGADKVNGNIEVKDATLNDNFKSLKNIDYKLSGGELIIADNEKTIGLAGIIGAQNSTTDQDTKNIFIEAAYFNPKNISKTSRKLNILSDAKYRFERGIDISQTKIALEMAINLTLEICGGCASEIIELSHEHSLAKKPPIELDLSKIKPTLGIAIEKTFITETLENLGFKISDSKNDILQVIPASHRSDVAITQDLIEEIIRIYGLDKIKSWPLEFSPNNIKSFDPLEIIRSKLANLGLIETINWSFVDSKLAQIFSDNKSELLIQNPIAQQLDYMRPNLIIGLLDLVLKNQSRGFDNLAVFEIGKVFYGINKEQQKNMVCSLRVGKNKTINHYKDQRDFDVFDIKKDLFNCLEELGFSSNSFQVSNGAPNYYHPYRSATLKLGKNIIAYFGQLHPKITKKMDISGKINLFELEIDNLPINLNKKITKKPFEVSDFQAVKRDFAFILQEDVKVGEILKKVKNIDKNLITAVNLFDIYCDEKLGKNKKSIAFSITLQPTDKTFTNEEIENISQKIIQKISQDFSGTLRE
jgi:phenylalanyl-tRNA synthetase beta chain